jgi:ABC-type lipoprotein export system ATPase subunit
LGGLDRPSAGKVTVDGQDLLNLSERDRIHYQRQKVGFVWQQTARNLIPYLSAQENIELPMTISWVRTPKEKQAWSSELLQAVGLYERRGHSLAQLSGGEQQRVAIAVALANRPVLLLGDEPTGEVDTATAQAIMDTFRKLGKLMDLTIIIVTHDPRIARQVDRVVAIRDGKISTETIRQVKRPVGEPGADAPAGQFHESQAAERQVSPPEKEAVTYHEYVVLDSAGRLQVPREWLEKLNIGKRAMLDLEGNTILIQPITDQEHAGAPRRLTLDDQLALLFSEEPPPAPKSLLERFRSRRKPL